jgi:hypothetical protein
MGKHKGEQVVTSCCSSERIMRHPNFAKGVMDRRTGRPFDTKAEDNLWAYERGRQWATIAPMDMPVFVKEKNRLKLNPKAVRLFSAASDRGYIR